MSNLSNYLIEESDGAVIHWQGNYTDKIKNSVSYLTVV